MPSRAAIALLTEEALALRDRLDRVRSFAMHETMVPAAAPSMAAQAAIERHLVAGRRALRGRIGDYLRWLRGPEGRLAPAAEAQRRFVLVRLLFNVALTQFDLFAQVVTQRSEVENGVWIGGLDAAAADALALPDYYESPPVVCYLDRGPGAAIRRARTRLPGGGSNPVAIIRVPRERMVGSGVASSLIHEVGHQAAALLGLVESLRPELRAAGSAPGADPGAWAVLSRWVSEIVADFWAVAKVGALATVGLIGVVSLPRAFVFRPNDDDPHPTPWLRVKLSCAMGRALYPHRQWAELERVWESFYPPEGLDPSVRGRLARIEAAIPAFVARLAGHRPPSLRGRSLAEVMPLAERRPERLLAAYETLRRSPARLRRVPPTFAFAVLGQARLAGRLGPDEESRALANLLSYWALRSTLDATETCVTRPRAGAPAPIPAA